MVQFVTKTYKIEWNAFLSLKRGLNEGIDKDYNLYIILEKIKVVKFGFNLIPKRRILYRLDPYYIGMTEVSPLNRLLNNHSALKKAYQNRHEYFSLVLGKFTDKSLQMTKRDIKIVENLLIAKIKPRINKQGRNYNGSYIIVKSSCENLEELNFELTTYTNFHWIKKIRLLGRLVEIFDI